MFRNIVIIMTVAFSPFAKASDLTTVSSQHSQYFLPAPLPVEELKKATVVLPNVSQTTAAVPAKAVESGPAIVPVHLANSSVESNGIPTIDGKNAKTEISQTIAKYMGHMQNCYDQELQAKPNISGKMIAKFTIGKEGKVTKSQIQSSTMNDAQTETCIAYMVSKIPFGVPGPGSIEVSYPLAFGIVPAFKK